MALLGKLRRRRSISSVESGDRPEANLQDAFDRSISQIVANLVLVTLFILTIRGLVPDRALWIFIVVTVVAIVIRIGAVVAFRLRRKVFSGHQWLLVFVGTMWASAGAWGLPCAAMLPEATGAGRLILMFYLTGLSLGGSAAYHALSLGAAAQFQNTLIFGAHGSAAIATLPTIGYMLTVGSGPEFMLAIAMLFALAMTWRSAALVQGVFNSAVNRSVSDTGTGLLNRRGFFEAVSDARIHHPGGRMLMIDIDHFKSINDRFGHAFGDRVIQHMGQTLRDCLPADSVAGRLGGEEFAVLLRSTAADQALAIAERVRSAFEHATRQMSQQSFYATCCVGISNPADQLMSIDALLSDADKMLYEAKARGRNCAKIAS